MAVAPMAPNLSLRSRPAVNGHPSQPPLPQDLPGRPVDGAEVAVQAAVEREATVSNKRSAPVRIRVRDFPYRLAGEEVVLLELAGDARFLRIHVHVGEHVHRA